jgi:hypothetical protein
MDFDGGVFSSLWGRIREFSALWMIASGMTKMLSDSKP